MHNLYSKLLTGAMAVMLIGSVGVQVKEIIIKIHIIQQHLKITMVGQKIIRMEDIRLIILPDM